MKITDVIKVPPQTLVERVGEKEAKKIERRIERMLRNKYIYPSTTPVIEGEWVEAENSYGDIVKVYFHNHPHNEETEKLMDYYAHLTVLLH